MSGPRKRSPAKMNMLGIGGTTRACAVIGDPITHSLSPPIHNAAFRSLGLDLVYLAFRVRRRGLAAAIEGAKALELLGLNVTRPHKTSVIRFLDSIDRIAREIGAVNTIVNADGELRGYNTDGQAALEVLRSLGGTLSGSKVVILGAGGAARAIAYYLSKAVRSISILNRTRTRGSTIATEIMRWGGAECQSCGLSVANVRREADQADVLINTLPVDVFPRFATILIRERLIRPGMVVFDANYNPKGNFLANAKRSGAKVAEGLDMLIGQAALSFKLWTGRDAPVKVMRAAAIEAREAQAG